MSETLARLTGRLSRVYDRTPASFLALRLSYAGGMQWSITDDMLTTTVQGGPGVGLSVDLSQYSLSTLSAWLATQPGYQVLYLDGTVLNTLSALVLVPSGGDIATSNGDHLYGAQNPNWLYLATLAAELAAAQAQIEALPLELATTTADGEWLDLLGSYYAVPRLLAEQDDQYAPRIPSEVILPRQNNVAISSALTAATGQAAVCTDAPIFGSPEPAFDASIRFSGAPHFFNAVSRVVYNLFDVSIGYGLLGSYSPSDFLTAVRGQIDRLRAAGTHLRNLTLTASRMGDAVPMATDSMAAQWTTAGLASNLAVSLSGGQADLTIHPPSGVFAGAGGFTANPTGRLVAAGGFPAQGGLAAQEVVKWVSGGAFAGRGGLTSRV
jgi:hypothetical protein